jgi:hypothetical protein
MCVGVPGVSAPTLSFFDFVLGEPADFGEAGRFGRTAEADIPEFLKCGRNCFSKI